VPASNTKIPACYVAMKYLGKNLPGIRYRATDDDMVVYPTGDPTFLHPDFSRQRVYDFLRTTDKRIAINLSNWNDEPWGNGWSWNDYNDSYMAERSAFPVYGNVVRISNQLISLKVVPEFFAGNMQLDSSALYENNYSSAIQRELAANNFKVKGDSKTAKTFELPFYTNKGALVYLLLRDTLRKPVRIAKDTVLTGKLATIHSGPTDSMLKPMMCRSDNFFAEQSLLMVSNELLGVMNDAKLIDTILKTDFKDLPQKPRWVDGSGLSRYNLFTPQDFVAILHKMQTEFGMERVKEIFPTGNEGTLSNYYKSDSSFIYAKTGSLSGVVAFSGFLYTQKNKLLLFSVLVNNHQASATAVRRSIETFLQGVRRRY
jgi:D-alanyl-D-alanine carboxypeptidase/D-alanyl-D-alanine-endopeptidase (penicillin-binding protein 4)